MSEEVVLVTVQQLRAMNRAGNPAFAGVFVVRKLSQRVAKNDNPFLVADFGDKTGSFGTTIFGDNPVASILRNLSEGAVVRLEGKLDYFQERLSPKVLRLEAIPPEALAKQAGLLDSLVETAPEDADLLWLEFHEHIDAIAHPELRATTRALFDEIGESFRVSPAAIAMHHAYRFGLLEHTVHMARAARALFPLYPQVDASLALAGVLLHDIGKTIEYEAGLAIRKSRRGILQGHVVLGYQLVRKHGLKTKLDPDLLERLEHIVLSHQGELEWGAAAMAATPEAVFVSLVDNLDARMGMVQRALRVCGPDDEFSDYLPGLKSSLLLTPPHAVPETATPPATEPPAASQ